MKKFLVVAIVLAMVCLSSLAFAAEVTVGGEAAVRSRWFQNYNLNGHAATGTNDAYTQTRYLLDVNVKADNVKGKLSIWNDFDTWGDRGLIDGTDASPKGTTSPFIREAYIDFMVPGVPVGLKAGRYLTTLANGWFIRSNYGGVDGWLVYAPIGNVTVAFQDVKLNEGTTSVAVDDLDAYTAVAIVKLSDAITVGTDLTYLTNLLTTTGANAANGRGDLWNLGVNVNGKIGPATLKVELDGQQGSQNPTIGGKTDIRGYQGVAMVTVAPIDILTVNATLAYGTGNNGHSGVNDAYINALDITQHYTFIYEYKVNAASGAKFTGFTNTTALEAGAMVQVAKPVSVGADVWWLRATEKTNLNGGSTDRDLGLEVDLKANWQISPNLSWNWQVGYLMAGRAYQNAAGDVTDPYGVQGILSLKF